MGGGQAPPPTDDYKIIFCPHLAKVLVAPLFVGVKVLLKQNKSKLRENNF